MNQSRNLGLDFIRAIAIGMVLIGHFLYGPYAEFSDTPQYAGHFGSFGVDLFFVLSGYLVGRIMQRTFDQPFGASHVWNFYLRRWMRTFPVYFLVLAAEAWWAGRSLQGAVDVIATHPMYLFFCQNLAWPMGGWYGVTWSLTVEEWFYVIFPAIFCILAAFGIKRRVLATTITSILLCLFLRIHVYTPEIEWDTEVRKVVFLRIDAIGFGVLCAILADSYRDFIERRSALIGLLGVLGVIAVLESRSLYGSIGPMFFFTGYFTMVPLVLTPFLPVAERLKWDSVVPTPAKSLIIWLSNHAYVLYLTHLLILSIMTQYKLYSSLWQAIGLYISGCFVIASLIRWMVEKPIMELRPAELKLRPHERNTHLAPVRGG